MPGKHGINERKLQREGLSLEQKEGDMLNFKRTEKICGVRLWSFSAKYHNDRNRTNI